VRKRVIFCVISCTSTSFANFQKTNVFLLVIAVILSIVLPIVIVCMRETMSKVPTNYIILSLFTVAQAYLISNVCSMTSPSIVLMAAVMTTGIVIALTIYAATTKTDFSMQGGLFFLLGSAFFLLIIFGLFSSNGFWGVLFCCIGAIIMGLYFIYDIQIIMKTHKVGLSIDDYILGAFILYVDIANMFLILLSLLGDKR